MKSYKKLLNTYYDACESIRIAFMEEYYCDKDIRLNEVDTYWIADRVGEVCFIGDQHWQFTDMVTALELKVPHKKLFDWYDYSLEQHAKHGSAMNLVTYLKTK
jgi:hypothetical protein